MAHEMEPEREDARLEWGRFLGEMSYPRVGRKEISLPGIRLDLVEREGSRLVVGEVKSSSRFLDASRMQVLFYLWRLREMGVEAEGELRFPGERRRLQVKLDEDGERSLQEVIARIRAIVERPLPPPAKRISYCRACAYRDFCWSDEPER